MNLKLHVWRQNGPDDDGHFETYDANDVLEDMSFLEMLDVVIRCHGVGILVSVTQAGFQPGDNHQRCSNVDCNVVTIEVIIGPITIVQTEG